MSYAEIALRPNLRKKLIRAIKGRDPFSIRISNDVDLHICDDVLQIDYRGWEASANERADALTELAEQDPGDTDKGFVADTRIPRIPGNYVQQILHPTTPRAECSKCGGRVWDQCIDMGAELREMSAQADKADQYQAELIQLTGLKARALDRVENMQKTLARSTPSDPHGQFAFFLEGLSRILRGLQ